MRYLLTFLQKFGLEGAKSTSTPLASSTQLTTTDGVLQDLMYYHQLVGSLLYLTLTRSDIAYSVNFV